MSFKSCSVSLTAAALVCAAAAEADAVTLTVVADSTVAVPGGSGNFNSGYNPPALSSGKTVFYSSTYNALFSDASGTLARIADFNTAIPSASGNFTFFGSANEPTIDGSTALFWGGGSGVSGLYAFSGGTLAKVLDTLSPPAIPGGTGNFAGYGFSPSLSNGVLAFSGGGSGASGIYTSDLAGGALTRIVDNTMVMPGSASDNFNIMYYPANFSGTVAFQASNSGNTRFGIYKGNGTSLETVFDNTMPIPLGSGTFTSISSPSIGSGGVAFYGFKSPVSGFYFSTGSSVHRVATTEVSIPGGSGETFSSWYAPGSVGGSRFAFVAQDTTGKTGLYVWDSATQALATVFRTGDTVDGQQISSVHGMCDEAFDGNKIVMKLTTASAGLGIWVVDVSDLFAGVDDWNEY